MTDDHCDFRAMTEVASTACSNAWIASSRPVSLFSIRDLDSSPSPPSSSPFIRSKEAKEYRECRLVLSYFL